ncbi:MAG TPA: redoxin domain-containing protein [Chiayiivirga sp.]|nr:redoxin domain-containing protein [Chiayiivirga sp.]
MTEFPLAPDLPTQLHWVNCSPQRLNAQRGRVVALVFWHAGSANAANVLADLSRALMRFADGLIVIGIHVPKFDAQRDSERVARAVNRMGVRFPVASDPDAITWQHYGIAAWPSVALIDAEGRLMEVIAGDQQSELLEERIGALLDDAGERGLRVYEVAAPAVRPEPIRPLAFPRGLALTADRLYVSDTGHHRVLECDHEGLVLRSFGSGNAGWIDGPGFQAGFNAPVGLVVVKNFLYVADSGNHSIRRIRLDTGVVDTVLGAGRGGVPRASANASVGETLLDRPWAVASDGARLFISMSASNQIWEFDLTSSGFRPLAGSSRLGLGDGNGVLAELGQPAGMVLVQDTLYWCDSQTSAVRSMKPRTGEVQTLIGHSLFEYGNEEGDRELARLQFPLDLTMDPTAPMLWIADTYNDAIGAWHLEGGGLVRFPFEHRLDGPAAVASSGAYLWIANTDAHEVLRMDVATGEIVVLPMTS